MVLTEAGPDATDIASAQAAAWQRMRAIAAADQCSTQGARRTCTYIHRRMKGSEPYGSPRGSRCDGRHLWSPDVVGLAEPGPSRGEFDTTQSRASWGPSGLWPCACRREPFTQSPSGQTVGYRSSVVAAVGIPCRSGGGGCSTRACPEPADGSPDRRRSGPRSGSASRPPWPALAPSAARVQRWYGVATDNNRPATRLGRSPSCLCTARKPAVGRSLHPVPEN